MTNGGSPPGLGGGAGGGFGDVGQAAIKYQDMVRGMKRLNDIENNVETDSINMDNYVKELPRSAGRCSGQPKPCLNRST